MCISGLFSNDSLRLLSFIFLNQPCTFFKSHFGLFFFSVLAQPSEFANDVGILLIYICTVKWDMHERGRKPNKSLDVHYYFKRYCWRCCCFANGNVIIFLSIVLFAFPVWNISSFFLFSGIFISIFDLCTFFVLVSFHCLFAILDLKWLWAAAHRPRLWILWHILYTPLYLHPMSASSALWVTTRCTLWLAVTWWHWHDA